ncbi:hypothetical protein QTO34_014689 [Cnephaeus nilssonii]|uniref:Uncharacterized protein n=1 Tax=Cnephaeus nilssonii TaxID=3371016 RepID=A0AA40LUI9_CNENI|nr:hypothetical protein QTO34_014689 [Eptesicus nilssonii]
MEVATLTNQLVNVDEMALYWKVPFTTLIARKEKFDSSGAVVGKLRLASHMRLFGPLNVALPQSTTAWAASEFEKIDFNFERSYAVGKLLLNSITFYKEIIHERVNGCAELPCCLFLKYLLQPSATTILDDDAGVPHRPSCSGPLGSVGRRKGGSGRSEGGAGSQDGGAHSHKMVVPSPLSPAGTPASRVPQSPQPPAAQGWREVPAAVAETVALERDMPPAPRSWVPATAAQVKLPAHGPLRLRLAWRSQPGSCVPEAGQRRKSWVPGLVCQGNPHDQVPGAHEELTPYPHGLFWGLATAASTAQRLSPAQRTIHGQAQNAYIVAPVTMQAFHQAAYAARSSSCPPPQDWGTLEGLRGLATAICGYGHCHLCDGVMAPSGRGRDTCIVAMVTTQVFHTDPAAQVLWTAWEGGGRSKKRRLRGRSEGVELGACPLVHQAFQKPPARRRLLKGLVPEQTGTQLPHF